jgi:tetratricopeptide (TPR) repeat protein
LAETVAIRYRAFLSYSHRDTAWGKWLHSALEGYRIDKELVGRQTSAGPVPKTLRPIFRDREDFSAGHSLTEQTLAALEASQFLIVLCSPIAAKSKYVNEEIRRFKALGRADRVIPLIVDGEPGDPERECFPPALRFKLGPDGALTEEREEPIAADARPQGDGKEIAKQKLVAGLLGLGFDEIVRRAERARRRRNRVRAAFAGVILLLTVTATGGVAYGLQQGMTKETLLSAMLKAATGFVDDAVEQAEKYAPRTAAVAFLGKAEGLFDAIAQAGRPTPEMRYRKAWMLIHFARNYEVLGQSDQQRDRATEALVLLTALAAEKPGDDAFRKDLSAAYIEVGNVQFTQGSVASALNSFREALAIAEGLVKDNRDNKVWQRGLSLAYDKVGDILVAQGNSTEALIAFQKGLAISERLDEVDTNARAQRDLAVSYNKIGDLKVKSDPAGALTLFRKSFAIRDRQAKADSKNLGLQRDLSVAHGKIGDLLIRQGNAAEALKSFSEGLAIRERLAKDDPSNAGWQRDLKVAYDNVGDALVAQGNRAQALTSFRAGLAIAERLAKADPNNTDWQRDLLISHNRLGELAIALGTLEDALTSLQASVAIAEHLAKSDPQNAGWQHDHALSLRKVGALRILQNNFPEALKVFNEAVAVEAGSAKAPHAPGTREK